MQQTIHQSHQTTKESIYNQKLKELELKWSAWELRLFADIPEYSVLVEGFLEDKEEQILMPFWEFNYLDTPE